MEIVMLSNLGVKVLITCSSYFN